jgi:hypothetical protein
VLLPFAVWPRIPIYALSARPGRNLLDSWPAAETPRARTSLAAIRS